MQLTATEYVVLTPKYRIVVRMNMFDEESVGKWYGTAWDRVLHNASEFGEEAQLVNLNRHDTPDDVVAAARERLIEKLGADAVNDGWPL
jgi:hypothetical protein